MDENIFEAASKKPKRHRLEKVASKDGLANPSKSELTDMLKRIREMKSDLENKLGFIYEKGKEAKVDVDSLFGETSASFTMQQIEEIRVQEKILQDKLDAIIPPESCIRKVSKSKEKLTQERKGKFRGARQKWIPVR